MRLPACLWVIAVLVSTPAAARSSEGSSTAGRDVARAAAIAASYGAITSIYRSVEHNRDVGGVANSYHLQGRAIDIARRPGVTHGQIAAALQRAGLTMIESLDEGDHSHFAFGSSNSALQTAAAASPPPPPIPEPPRYPPIVADQHGTLRIDLPQPQLAQR
ncbi:MAG TPA: D-Ala-D-Ala carboxypeptidase family metallohydrolase [Sphingomicrobium sp.]|nr:D-Ala-D-Ala carboxypeptidase family metallohydrolase [Sphingomicrobium sp.]